jgi:hypothetical protein
MALQRLTEPAPMPTVGAEAASAPAEAPRAFVSFALADDRRLKGALSRLRDKLQLAVWQIAGRQFQVLQDKDGIAFREHWPERLEEALEQTSLFVPILTPAYFENRDCRAAALAFLDYEMAMQRGDLVLPIYLTEAPVMEDLQLRAEDSLAWRLRQRRLINWRSLDLIGHWSEEVEARIADLGQAIAAVALPAEGGGGEPPLAGIEPAPGEASAHEQALVKALASKEAALHELERRLRVLDDQRIADKAAYANERQLLAPWRGRFWFAVTGLGGGLLVALAYLLR